jgi:hypothetical protein
MIVASPPPHKWSRELLFACAELIEDRRSGGVEGECQRRQREEAPWAMANEEGLRHSPHCTAWRQPGGLRMLSNLAKGNGANSMISFGPSRSRAPNSIPCHDLPSPPQAEIHSNLLEEALRASSPTQCQNGPSLGSGIPDDESFSKASSTDQHTHQIHSVIPFPSTHADQNRVGHS